MKKYTTKLFKWICKVYSNRYEEAKENSTNVKTLNLVSLDEILKIIQKGDLLSRKLALLSLVVFVNNLPILKIQPDSLKKLSMAIQGDYVFINLLSSSSLIEKSDLDGFCPGSIPGKV